MVAIAALVMAVSVAAVAVLALLCVGVGECIKVSRAWNIGGRRPRGEGGGLLIFCSAWPHTHTCFTAIKGILFSLSSFMLLLLALLLESGGSIAPTAFLASSICPGRMTPLMLLLPVSMKKEGGEKCQNKARTARAH